MKNRLKCESNPFHPQGLIYYKSSLHFSLQARHWFERAAQQGDAEALYNIGVFHELGQGGFKPDKKIALEY